MLAQSSDPSIIRLLDGYEWSLVSSWISINDILLDFSQEGLKRFITACDNVLRQKPIFNLGIRIAGKYHYWVDLPFSTEQIASESWVEPDKNFINNSKTDIITAFDNRSISDPNLIIPYRITYAAASGDKKNRFRLTLYLSHTVADGKSLISAYAEIAEIAKQAFSDAQIPEKTNRIRKEELINELGDYGKMDCFQGLNESDIYSNKPLESWKIETNSLIPPLPQSDGGSVKPHYVNQYLTYAYDPVKEYCAKHGVSIQSLIMAVMTKAMREYNKIPSNLKIAVSSPSNTRTSVYASEKCRASKYFSRASSVYTLIEEQPTLELEVKECMKKLRATKNSPDQCLQLIKVALALDPETYVFTPLKGGPNFSKICAITASNIGRAIGNTPIIHIHAKCNHPISVVLYAYYTEKTLYLLILRPNCLGSDLEQVIEKFAKQIMDMTGSYPVSIY